MKKILVTGAAGTIGYEVIKYLLSEGKYEITALDLKNNRSMQKLKKYKKRINIIYGDVYDRVLIEALIKDIDIVIHLAGVLPPLADYKKDLAYSIDYLGTENIVRAINYYNPKTHLFYASSMNLYKDKENVNSKTPIKIDELDYYLYAKKESEKLIKSKLKNYTIYRFPLVLGNIKESVYFNNFKNDYIYYITSKNAAYSLVKGLNYLKELNKNIYNVTDGKILYQELITKILHNYGLCFKYILERMFVDKVHSCKNCLDTEELNNFLGYRIDTLDDYFNRLAYAARNRHIEKYLAHLFIRGNK